MLPSPEIPNVFGWVLSYYYYSLQICHHGSYRNTYIHKIWQVHWAWSDLVQRMFFYVSDVKGQDHMMSNVVLWGGGLVLSQEIIDRSVRLRNIDFRTWHTMAKQMASTHFMPCTRLFASDTISMGCTGVCEYECVSIFEIGWEMRVPNNRLSHLKNTEIGSKVRFLCGYLRSITQWILQVQRRDLEGDILRWFSNKSVFKI